MRLTSVPWLRPAVTFGLTVSLCTALAGAALGDTPTVSLDLARAQELAVQNNLDLRAAILDYEHAKLNFQKAQGELLASPSRIAQAQAEAALFSAQRRYEQAVQDLQAKVMQAYYAVRNAEEQLHLAEQNLQQTQIQLEAVKAKRAEGLASPVDLLSAERSLLQAEISTRAAKTERELASLRLAAILGQPEGTQFVFTDQSDLQFEPLTLSLEEAIASANKTSTQLQQLEVARDVARLQEKAAEIDETSRLQREILVNRRVRAELDLEQARQQLQIQVRQQYYALQQKAEQIKVAEKSRQVAEETYRVTKLRHEQGLEVDAVLQRAASDLQRAQQAEIDALVDYTVSRLSFIVFVGAGK